MIKAVVFDLDGVLIESDRVWASVRRSLVAEWGGRWSDAAYRDLMGMNSSESARYMRDELGVMLSAEAIDAAVVDGVGAAYESNVELMPGAMRAVTVFGARYKLGLASAAQRVLIKVALNCSGLRPHFSVVVSGEEVSEGKPSPDVYVEALRRLEVQPADAVAIEDSTNGILSAVSAGMWVIAVPNRQYPPSRASMSKAHVVLTSLEDLTMEMLGRAGFDSR